MGYHRTFFDDDYDPIAAAALRSRPGDPGMVPPEKTIPTGRTERWRQPAWSWPPFVAYLRRAIPSLGID